jgi:basic amino acid/polyamine antiporter, APA family
MSDSNQKIGLWPLTSLVTGNLVGSGVFLLPATLAGFGSISILGWVVTSIGAMILALVFAVLSNTLPRTGGPYAYVSSAFGKNVGFFVAWGYWSLAWISNSALLSGAVGYLSTLTAGLSMNQALCFELIILLIITCFNLLGIKTAGKGELVITITKVAPLILLPIIGVFYISYDNLVNFNTSRQQFWPALNSVAFITIWGFVGVEAATVPGGQVINAKKNIPLATIMGTMIAAFIYILGTVTIFGVIPHEILVNSKAPYADAASIIFGGSLWGTIVAIAAIISCIGSLNGWTIVTARIAQAAAEDKLFPSFFAKTNKYETPYLSVLISSGLTVPFVFLSIREDLLAQFNMIIDISVTFILIIYLACVLAMFNICRRENKLTTSVIILGISALLFVALALKAADISMIFLSIGFAALGIPMWLYTKNGNHPKVKE